MASRSNPNADGVFISTSEAREMTRLLKLLQTRLGPQASVQSHQLTSQDDKASSGPGRTQLQARAQAIFAERARRSQFFSKSIFGEPAWEMLVTLYIMDGRRVTVGKLVNMIDAPQTTALRWLQYLERKRYVARRSDPDDRRVVCIELLEGGRELLDAYFSTLPEGFSALG